MTFCPSTLAALPMPDISPYLTKGAAVSEGVLLRPGDLYTWLLLGGGLLLVLGGLALMKMMYSRVKFFALEFGKGRLSAILPHLVLGTLMVVGGGAAGWVGWQALGYSLKLDATGLTERSRGGMIHYSWQEAKRASERIKATEFWVEFVQDKRTCRVRFQQLFLGEALQDKAIRLTESGLIHGQTERIQEETVE